MKRTTELRQLIDRPQIAFAVGVFDVFSARVAEESGFRIVIAGGGSSMLSIYGKPDVGLTGALESIEACRWIANSTTLCVLADADTGYGNAVTVYDVVRRYEQAGAAGVIIEDQTWPKRCGHYPGLRSVISAEEMAGKIEAACEARSDPDFVIVARTDAAGGLGIDTAVHRANLYHTAGAALVFADAIPTEKEVLRFAQEVDGPVAFHAGLGLQSLASIPDIPPKELERHGAALAMYSRLLLAGAIRGMRTAAREFFATAIENDALVDRPDLVASWDELLEISQLAEYQELERRYVRTGDGG